MKKFFLFLAVISIFSFFASAQLNCTSFNINNTVQLLFSIPVINSQISSCDIMLPDQFGILNNKNIVVTINMNSGSTQNIYFSFTDNVLSELSTGFPQEYAYEIVLSESTLNSLLQSEDLVSELLLNYDNGNIAVNPNGVWPSVVWFFAKFFI